MSAATFSYAQAAKGLSTPVASSKPTSGTVTPAKDTPVAADGAVPSWADDADAASSKEQPATSAEAQAQITSKPIQSAQPIETPSISSPDLGASSASTVTKDDDVSSLPNASSESTWDNKSQASTSVDKSVEPVEKTSEKVKKGKKDAVVKPLQEAPPPAVNIWKQRAAEQQKVKASAPPAVNGTSPGSSTRKTDAEGKPRTFASESKVKGQDEEKTASGRKENRAEADPKHSKGKPFDKDAKLAANVLSPPPTRDQESWPTPETAIDEDRKKAQEKGEKVEKDRKESASTGSHGKQEWKKVPFTPSVVFNTPLPNAANTRRGGRPGGRGASQNGSRSGGFGANGAAQSDRDVGATSVTSNGEHAKRDRVEAPAPRDASPKSKRNMSPALKDTSIPSTSEKAAARDGSEHSSEARSTKPASVTDSNTFSNQNGNLPRQFPGRSNKPRRGDFAGAGERRRDGENSPTKDNTFDDRRSAATQTDSAGEGDRRSGHFHDGPNGHHKQGRFGSYPNGRDRTRGGGRGGRASYSNGSYANGNMGAGNNASSMPMGPRSPTVFNPENPSFFGSQSKYGRNGHRSQSITTDAYRFGPYSNAPQVPALQTYNMYDYNMMPQPMSAVPYSPYMDQYALFAMLTTQVEYYFSVDNLLKDMYLRRHMDSQGFVGLEFIAGFNRIKHLSADLDLIKLVCQQSAAIEYRTGEDGQDRLRRRDSWEQWVLPMPDRDESARNEGPKELHHPPVPHVNGFEQSSQPQWTMSAVAPSFGTEGPFSQVNGYHSGAVQDMGVPVDGLPNGTAPEGQSDGALPNGHSPEHSTKA